MTCVFIRLMGRLCVEVDGEIVGIRPLTAAVLARLVIAEGGLVTVDDIYRDVWQHSLRRVDRQARTKVQKRITELRSILDDETLLTDRGGVSGYRLILPRSAVDIHRVTDLLHQAAREEPAQAVVLLRQALGWCGDRPLIDVEQHAFARVAIDRLAGLIAEARLRLERLDGAATPQALTFALPARLPRFTGRTTELAGLAAALDGSGMQAIKGIGGVGKTQLAVEFAHRHRSAYEAIVFFDAEKPDLLSAQFFSLGTALGLRQSQDPVATVAMVWHELARRGRYLVIFDNAERPEDIAGFLPPSTGHAIITSRFAVWRTHPAIELDVFTRTESVEFLAAAGEHADEIAELLGDLPLALHQARSYISVVGCEATEYVNLIRSNLDEMLDHGTVPDRPKTTVARLWHNAARHIEAGNPATMQLLRICAMLAPDPIPLDLFTEDPSILPPPIATAAADPIAWNQTLLKALEFGLMSRAGRHVKLHRLVQAAIRRAAPAQQRQAAADAAVLLLSVQMPHKFWLPATWPRWRELLPHILTVVDDESTDAHPRIWLLNRSAAYLSHTGMPAPALRLMQRAVSISESAFGVDSTIVAMMCNDLGYLLIEDGRPDDALPHIERSLKIWETNEGPSCLGFTPPLHNMATILVSRHRYAEALAMFERCREIDSATWGDKHEKVACHLQGIGDSRRGMGDLEGAKSYYHRAAEIYLATHEVPDIATITSVERLGRVQAELGELDEADATLRRAAQFAVSILGPDHPLTARLQFGTRERAWS